jgi:hypothetical protein
MANTFLNATEYANVMLLLLKNQLVMGRLVSGQFKDMVTDQNGLSINIKRPPRFVAKSGATLAAQNIAVGSTSVTVDQYKNVHISVGDLEAVQSWNALMKSETMKSAASTLAHDVDLFLHDKLTLFPSHVGTIGETVKTPAQAFKAHTRLMDQSVPNSDLNGVLTFEDAELIRGSLLAGNIDGINRTALQRTKIPLMSEVDWYATQNVKSLTTGSRASALVNGANQHTNYVTNKAVNTQSLIIDSAGAAGATIVVGDIFTIADVYAVNARTNQTLSFLKQFVVTAATTTAGAGEDATVTISPPIIVGGTGGAEADTNTAFATVSAIPADNAVVTWLGTASTAYLVRAVFHKSAIALVSARLETPMSDTSSFATDPETGISIRYWRGSDIATGAHVHRFDMIYGAKVVMPEFGVRLNGAA